MSNYLIYPVKTMNITQDYASSFSHKPHSTGDMKDYPIDEACENSGRSYCYCPCDEMKVVRVYGVGTKGTNTVWLESTSKVNLADGTSDYATICITHPNDDTLKNIKVGQKFKRKEAMFLEGTDGNATGNHFHIAVGKGKMTDGGWLQNDKGSWVLRTTNGACKPESAFYIDESFTTVKNAAGIKFKKMPTTAKKTTTTTTESKSTSTTKKYTTGNYTVMCDVLNVRSGAGTSYSIKKFSQLTANAQAQVKKIRGKAINGLVKGCVITVTEVKNNWGKIPSGWICLDYCKKN